MTTPGPSFTPPGPPEDVLSADERPADVAPMEPSDPTVASGQTVASGPTVISEPPRRRSVGSLQLALAVLALLAGAALFLSGYTLGARTATTPGTPAADQALFAPFWDTWDSITRSYVGPVDQKKLVEGAIDGLIKALGDPFSAYMSPADLQSARESLGGQFEGIGAVVSARSSAAGGATCTPLAAGCRMTVVSTIAASPAETAGIRAGDVMTAIDDALERPDLDASRTALMGGSFGGYMANWVAGHTDRFRAIVTHASLWDLRGFHGTSDTGAEWEFEMGDPYRDPSRYIRESPSEHIAEIRTPMLVIHGEQDFRVPVSEALRLWTDLRRHGVAAKFLYFPDENHWILKPQNARLWYATVLAFLDEHVLGKGFERPALL